MAMPPRGDTSLSPPARNCSTPQNAPLVIISEQGRHSVASRRIVRAQAARASAAQSRVTRARNREEREGTYQDVPRELSVVPGTTTGLPIGDHIARDGSHDIREFVSQKPMVAWLVALLDISVPALQEARNGIASGIRHVPGPDTVGSFSSFQPSRIAASATQSITSTETAGLKLPMALPRGFVGLQHRIPVSATLLTLWSRTACIDFASPGVETRLNQLLFDLLISSAILRDSSMGQQDRVLQDFLCLACACLTIFQGQRTNGRLFSDSMEYQSGLKAAWAEAMSLDPEALKDTKTAGASIWAIFIISVTTASQTESYQRILQVLLDDLQLIRWEQVRKLLLDFVYPVSLLDELCSKFYHDLRA